LKTLDSPRTITTWLTIAVLLLGIGVQIAFCFPVHKYAGDSDAVVSGLCAFRVTQGQLPLFFPGGFRLSSQSCYVVAAMFRVFGPTRTALAASSVLYGTLFLLFAWLALRQASDQSAALWGLLLVCLPPFQFWLVTYPPWGYSEIMASCACLLWLGFRLFRHPQQHPMRDAILLGFCTGFAFWTSPQTIMISGPLVALLVFARKMPWRSWVVVSLSALVAVYPYWLVIAYRGTAPFANSIYTQPTSGYAQLSSNAAYLMQYSLPVLFFSQIPAGIRLASMTGLRVVLVSGLLVVLTGMALRAAKSKERRDEFFVLLFPLAILIFSSILYVVSGAGAIRGWTVRYVVPVWLIAPLAATLIVHYVRQRAAKVAVATCVLALAFLNAVEYPIFRPQVRSSQVAGLAQQHEIIAWLQDHHRYVVIGNYWTVYSLNFDGRRTLIALPEHGPQDYLHYDRELPAKDIYVALLDEDLNHLQEWTKRIGRSGHYEVVADHINVFLFDEPLDRVAIQEAREEAE